MVDDDVIGRRERFVQAKAEISRLEQQIFLFRLISRISVGAFFFVQIAVALAAVGVRHLPGVVGVPVSVLVAAGSLPGFFFCLFWQLSENRSHKALSRAFESFVDALDAEKGKEYRDSWISYRYLSTGPIDVIDRLIGRNEPLFWGYLFLGLGYLSYLLVSRA